MELIELISKEYNRRRDNRKVVFYCITETCASFEMRSAA